MKERAYLSFRDQEHFDLINIGRNYLYISKRKRCQDRATALQLMEM